MPSRIIAGLGLSHVPSVGVAYDRGKMQTPAWKPLSDAYIPVREWLARLKPDVAIVVYNDHGADFMFDKYPSFAIGAADRYGIADEGFGTRPLPEVRGDSHFSIHLCESLVENEFDLTVCQELAVEHGFLVPMNLCFEHRKDGWPVAAVPLQVNVIQHPLPTARRCYKLGQALRKAVSSYDQDLRVGRNGFSKSLAELVTAARGGQRVLDDIDLQRHGGDRPAVLAVLEAQVHRHQEAVLDGELLAHGQVELVLYKTFTKMN